MYGWDVKSSSLNYNDDDDDDDDDNCHSCCYRVKSKMRCRSFKLQTIFKSVELLLYKLQFTFGHIASPFLLTFSFHFSTLVLDQYYHVKIFWYAVYFLLAVGRCTIIHWTLTRLTRRLHLFCLNSNRILNMPFTFRRTPFCQQRLEPVVLYSTSEQNHTVCILPVPRDIVDMISLNLLTMP